MLALTCPMDPADFRKAFDDYETEEVEEKFDLYGTQILNVCIQHKFGTSRPKGNDKSKPKSAGPSFNKEAMHQKFSYQDPGASSSAVRTPVAAARLPPTVNSTGKKNFRPAGTIV
ncbi:hypothetical protein PLICRDRAFT_588222 [Plicaturopsis crispa FD-325 SS-3]|nr:hypothetical protein PLICRDRAFT_588222 [Plicaturopsis crispa FD-325 SS-3]